MLHIFFLSWSFELCVCVCVGGGGVSGCTWHGEVVVEFGGAVVVVVGGRVRGGAGYGDAHGLFTDLLALHSGHVQNVDIHDRHHQQRNYERHQTHYQTVPLVAHVVRTLQHNNNNNYYYINSSFLPVVEVKTSSVLTLN